MDLILGVLAMLVVVVLPFGAALGIFMWGMNFWGNNSDG